MPEISRFYGIIIYMCWKDHNPPHIHVSYGDYDCNISIKDKIVKGEVPAKIISKLLNGLICMKMSLWIFGIKLKMVVNLTE